MGAANLINLGVKAATNRQYPYQKNSRGEFWEGGKSSPSGHAAASFAFAAVLAHRRTGLFTTLRQTVRPTLHMLRETADLRLCRLLHDPCQERWTFVGQQMEF